MSMSEVIDQLYHWPICPNCAELLPDTDLDQLEYCGQCGKRLDSAAEAISE